MRRLLTALIFAITAAPAIACINDSELPTHEREFRSSYQTDRPPSEPFSPVAQEYGPMMVAGAGVLLVIGAGFVAAYRQFGRG